jgi:SAM-dependent methyltransferase
LLARVPPGRAAAILGAGNGNDVDLAALAGRFERVHLVDLDGEALAHAAATPGAREAARIVVHAGVDLGVIPAEDSSAGAIDHAVEAAARGVAMPVGDLDLAVSACLLSQLVLSAAEWVGAEHPRCLDLVRAVRLGHLRALARSLRPGGVGLLVSDMVSSDTDPGLAAAAPGDLVVRMERLVRAGNFFTGTNPFVVANELARDAELAALARDVRLHAPWVWRIAERRHYLVFAVSFRRSAWTHDQHVSAQPFGVTGGSTR